jgi:hypothetical protein
MKAHLLAFALGLLALPGAALADPTGSYSVVGENAGGNGQYTGTVEVVRTGQTYVVYWNIAGKEFVGTGIGAQLFEDSIRMGPATDNDTGLSVGYISEENFGIAMFFEQEDGTWQGVWTYGGGETVAGETWTRR